jgi:NAD(P)-dependent dehydrogenase (short-subunit alcohol dehydrogenase family)
VSNLTQLFSMQGLNALVVGGSSGIGREIALGFAAAGARVAVVGRDEQKLADVQRELRSLSGGSNPAICSADMQSVAEVKELAAPRRPPELPHLWPPKLPHPERAALTG